MLRAQKKELTRQAIVESALELFLSQGFDATTVDEIADVARISRRTFFRYFPSKEAVFFAHQEQRLQVFRAWLAEDVGEDEETPLWVVRRAFLRIARVYMEQRSRLVPLYVLAQTSRNLRGYDQQLDERWEQEVYRALCKGRESDKVRQNRARWTAGAMMGVSRALLRAWFVEGGQGDLVAQGEEACLFMKLESWFDGR